MADTTTETAKERKSPERMLDELLAKSSLPKKRVLRGLEALWYHRDREISREFNVISDTWPAMHPGKGTIASLQKSCCDWKNFIFDKVMPKEAREEAKKLFPEYIIYKNELQEACEENMNSEWNNKPAYSCFRKIFSSIYSPVRVLAQKIENLLPEANEY